MIFSGDLAHSGEEWQFEEGYNWLDKLASIFLETQFLVVPGNHDVIRSQTQPYHFRNVANNLKSYSEWRDHHPANTLPHLKNFFLWAEQAAEKNPQFIKWDNIFATTHRTEISGVEICLVGLNSALFCCDDEDKDNLVIDEAALNEILIKNKGKNCLTIVVSHHPLEDLSEWNKKRVFRVLAQSNGANLYLHGHLHSASGHFAANNLGQNLTTLAVGSAYQGSDYQNGFAVYVLDFTRQEITPQKYGYSSNSGEWVFNEDESQPIGACISIVKRNPTRKRRQISSDSTTLMKAEKTQQFDQIGIHLQTFQFVDIARILRDKIIPVFQESGEFSTYKYALKHRIKDTRRIINKAIEKSTVNSKYDVSEMSDICGIRFITLYHDSIPYVVESLIKSCLVDPGSSFRIFGSKTKLHVDVNVADDQPENLRQYYEIVKIVKDISEDIIIEKKIRVTGYSSVHIVVTVDVSKLNNHEIQEAKFEVQVRSSLEDIWGEIDHELRYGSKRGEVGVTWNRHLNILKNLLDGLVNYIDLIRKSSEDEPIAPPSGIGDARTVSTPSYQMGRLSKLPPHLRAKLDYCYSRWKEADAGRSTAKGNPGSFRRAGDAFMELFLQHGRENLADPDLSHEFQYVLQMEAAYSYFYTGDSDDVEKARGLYVDVLNYRPNDATAHYRLGTIYRDKGDFSRSIDHLQNGLVIVKDNLDEIINEGHWLFDSLRRGLGRTFWRLALSSPSGSNKKVDYYDRSIEFVYSVIIGPSENSKYTRLGAVNDPLYYVWEARKFAPAFEPRVLKSSDLTMLQAELIAFAKSPEGTNHRLLDTVLRVVENDREQAVMFGLRVEDSLEKNIRMRKDQIILPDRGSLEWVVAVSKELDTEELDCFLFAQKTLAKYGRSSYK